MNFTIRVTNVQELFRLARFLDEACPDARLVQSNHNDQKTWLEGCTLQFCNVQNDPEKVIVETF